MTWTPKRIVTANVNQLTGEIEISAGGKPLPILNQAMSAAFKMIGDTNSQSVAGDATNGRVMQTQLPAVAPFFGVRLVYENWDTSAVMNIDGVKVAPSPSTGGAGQAPANSTLTWSPYVTFGGAQAVAVPVAVVGPAGNILPGVVVSDFVQVTSIPRTDIITAPPILRVASHLTPSAAATIQPSVSTASFAALNVKPANPGMNIGNANLVLALASMTSSASAYTYDIYGGPINPVGAIFSYSTSLTGLSAFGDSLVQGIGSGVCGWPEFVAFNSYGAQSISCDNWGSASQKSIDSFAKLKIVAAKYKPKYAAFKAWSPNDGNTQANYDAAWGNTLEAVDFCLANKIIPVVLTSGPANGYTWSLIKKQNARVMALPSSVVKVDAAAVLNNPASDGTILPAYDSDGTHYTEAGYIAIANVVIAAIPV